MIKTKKLFVCLMSAILALSIFIRTDMIVMADDQNNTETITEIYENDKLLLAALIHCEAGGEPYEGQVAVGAVVMNRMKSEKYPNNIHDVIYDHHQFGPAISDKLDKVYNSQNIYPSCIRAAEEAISGVSNIGECLNFHRYDGCDGIVIGNHVFK